MSVVVAHVWVPDFYVEAEVLLDSRLKGAPMILVTKSKRVMATSPGARNAGIRPGMSLSAARLVHPDVIDVGYVPERYDRLADDLWEACAQYSPAVEPLAQHEAFVDLSGCADVPETLGRISQDIQGIIGSRPVFGVARCKLVARVASGVLDEAGEMPRGEEFRHLITGSAREAGHVHIVTGKEKEFLAPLPVDVLWTLDEDVIERLLRLGLKRVGEVQAIGRSALVDTLGEVGHIVYERSLGTDRARVIPVHPKRMVTFRKVFDDDVSSEPILARIVEAGAVCMEQKLRASSVTARRWGIVLDIAGREGESQVAREQRFSRPPEMCGGVTGIYRSLLRTVLLALYDEAPSEAESPVARESPVPLERVCRPKRKMERWEPATGGLPRPVRALSLVAADLVPVVAAFQADMFAPNVTTDQARSVDAVAVRVREKFGTRSLFPGSLLQCERKDRLLMAWEACLHHEEDKQVASGCRAGRPTSGEVLLEAKMASCAFHC
ncbi:MAG: hypothetical protein NUW12_08470 [Firmicutes bacterium]|jgi:DNA polymerase-4|nr:hypothetical protein [Bacillota bacterium]MDH7496116.1 hypothetical protein [Bacillota bacterium]